MYRTEPHPDPYANQYPPPPPLAPEHNVHIDQQHVYTPPNPQPVYPPEMVSQSMPTQRQEYGAYHVPTMNDTQQQHYGHTTTYDPQAVTMDEYRQTELSEQHYNNRQPQHDRYYQDYHDEPDMTSSHTPMVSQPPPPPPFLHNNKQPSQQTVQPEDIESYHPPTTQNQNNKYTTPAPMMAPEDEQGSYKRNYYERDDDRRGSGCNCCCYNPAMTCCSCFCFLISLGFLAAGIALMIAAKVG
jgi:hypothetical protein